MTTTNRRSALKSAGLLLAVFGEAASAKAEAKQWSKGIEGQRQADLKDGTFLNPIMAGDHPDPSILKDGFDYYMTFSSFDTNPGLVLWHSRDLVNWQPIGTALSKYIGSIWAPDLCKHNGRYFIYFPSQKTSNPDSKTSNWVVWSDRIAGPWSDPIEIGVPEWIDPGHAVGEDGKRYLFFSGGNRIALTDDGLSTIGKLEHVFDAWRFPKDWDVGGFAPEGPKITKHGDYFYMILAEGGTAGPPTGHMVTAARSRSINGPWEHHPRNPLVRTTNVADKWWSRGHATLVEGIKNGEWWAVLHGYENGFYTLGRQTLLAPITWTKDGWLEFGGGDLSKPIKKPAGGISQVHGISLSDDFSTDKSGIQWSFFSPGPGEASRVKRSSGVLHLTGKGTAPSDSAPLLFITGDQAYEFECEIAIDAGTSAGLLLFYDDKLYCGLGFDEAELIMHRYGVETARTPRNPGRSLFMRGRNNRHIVSFFTSENGTVWDRFERGMEVSGYHHNVRGGFMMLKPGLYVSGQGEARIKNFKYRAI